MFQTEKGKTFGEKAFEFIICLMIGGLLGAGVLYAIGAEPLI